MMKLKLFLLTGICMLLASCSITTSYDYDKSVNFSQYKTFSIYQEGFDKLNLNDIDKNRVARALVGQLKAKGLTESADGDLKVNVLASSKKIINVDNDPYWGYGWGSTSSTVYTTREGRLVIHLIDSQKNILVWEGIADGLDVEDGANKEGEIYQAIQKVFTYYPPKEK